MKVSHVRLRNFKRFSDRKIDFRDPISGIPRDLIVLKGQNGSGKTSVLQAIAATLGCATKRLSAPAKLHWPGFNLDLANYSWPMPLEVVIDVHFSNEEVAAVVEYFNMIPGLSERETTVEPSQESCVSLKLRDGVVRTRSARQLFQFWGREYAKQVVKLVSAETNVFERVGTVYWCTEQRTFTSLTPEEAEKEHIEYNEDQLRDRLAKFMYFHERVSSNDISLRPGQRNIFADLEHAYKTVFPDRRFAGSAPRSGIDEVLGEPWFFLSDQNHQYEISEMSGGERAIFPILFDFANWRFHNSVILIDELELHLHPPMQQAFIRALRRLGKNNQFIITTHSDWVSDIVPSDAIISLDS